MHAETLDPKTQKVIVQKLATVYATNLGLERRLQRVLIQRCNTVAQLITPPRAINFGEFINGKPQQALSPALAQHEADIHHFYDVCHELCMKLLKLFALGLKARNLASSRIDVALMGDIDRSFQRW